MKLISYDIGIRNMAYCIFDIVSDELIVQDWNVLNLAEMPESGSGSGSIHRCSCQKPPKKLSKKKQKDPPTIETCSKMAKYEKNGAFFCEKHATTETTNLGHIIPTKEISDASLRKLSKEDLITLGLSHKCNTVSDLKTKKALLEYLHKYFLDKCFVPIVPQKRIAASDIDLITIGRNMKTQLDLLKEVSKNTTHVIMENQISPLAGRMKTVQGMLAQYYIMTSDPVEIIFVSSANKLKGLVPVDVNENQNLDLDQKENQKSTYKKHKIDSIDICNRFLAENPSISSWTQIISSKTKKDDFADCFLQGIWYLKQSKIITYADNLKINLV